MSDGSTPWHAITPEQALERLHSQGDGLEEDDAARRLARHGSNRLSRSEPVPAWRILLAQFGSLVVVLLMSAGIVALMLGDALDAVAIAAVLAINTGIGFTVELRARRAMDSLLRYEVPTVRVVRAGRAEVISSDLLVPGDVIQLEEGDNVPADARLVTSTELRVNEAPLTGESVPVDKAPEPVAVDTLMADRTPMVYSGTSVTLGRATAVVTETGANTELGRVGALIATVESDKTPLEVRLDGLARRLVAMTLIVAGVVTLLGVARGAAIGLMIETGIALAIAAVPEGLPAVATIALAVGLRRMARRNALVRRLSAVEALGATTVLCTDKTGTLTAGQMTAVNVGTVDRILSVTGTGFTPVGEFVEGREAVNARDDPWLHRLLEACALTSRAALDASGVPLGDPTDAALLVVALKGGVDPEQALREAPRQHEIAFTSRRRSSASVHSRSGNTVIYSKGSPSTLLDQCASWWGTRGSLPLTAEARSALEKRNEQLAADGLRVIALASGSGAEPTGMTLLGLVGIVDPAASGVPETIHALRAAGIRTVMVTGDQRATAEAIARALDTIGPDEASLDAHDLGRLSDADLANRMSRVAVLSRVSPEDKVRIVSALQDNGEIVAMIGDGVNDAAALRKADIGVAMGRRGTDVAKETAAMVLTDDRFVTIAAAVEEGRVIYENIRKFVFYLFSCNVAEVLVLLGASVLGMPIPLLPLQILWLNLVTDTFPALALALEPAEPGIMTRPPRDPAEPILSRRFVKAMGLYASLITGVTLAGYAWGLQTGVPERSATIAFMTLALAQLFHLGNARSRGPVVSPRRALANPWAVAAVPLVIALQLAAVYLPALSAVLGTTPLAPGDWLVVGSLSIVPAAVGQVIEVAQQRR